MKHFLKNIFFFLFILAILLFVADRAISMGLRNNKNDFNKTLSNLYNGTINAEIIINGSSKACVQISPEIIDSTLNTNSYNLGINGMSFIPQKMQYNLYRKYNKKPQAIIQIVSLYTLHEPKGVFVGYMKFAPYLFDKEVRKTMFLYDGFSKKDHYLPMSKYYGQRKAIKSGLKSLLGMRTEESTDYKGYHPHDMPWDGTFDKLIETLKSDFQASLNEEACLEFENYIEQCKNEGIQVVLIFPPVYHKSLLYVQKTYELKEYYSQIAKKHKVSYLDYSKDTLGLTKKYFYNSQHLNKTGAELFSKKLSNDLKNHIALK